MSFSNPKLTNPCSKFIEYKGDIGVFRYWDKEQEKNVELQTPAYLVILDQLSTIKGFSDEFQSGIYSNEVHSLTNEILKVKSFKGYISIVGKYQEIKGEIASAGGKFTKSVYAMMFDKDNNVELVNFQLSGSAFSAWLEFKFDAQRHIVCITGENTDEKKGAIKYKKPVFKRFNMKNEIIQDAVEMDKQLQDYLRQYKQESKEEEIQKEEKTSEEVWHETNYEQDKHQMNTSKREHDPDDDLPF